MSMKYVAAYMMAVLAENESPKKKDVEKILSAVGIKTESDIMDAFLKEVQGKSIHELVAAGMTKLQSVPTGAVGAAKESTGEKVVAKAEEKAPEVEESEEEEEDMGFSLFD